MVRSSSAATEKTARPSVMGVSASPYEGPVKEGMTSADHLS